ncbi:PTS sugar transporter subunit IIA [Xylanimonas ulmi]|uniref:PTS system N-acetylglucosamine-specific IIA component n=1 Tax=Xylanimonas ulmi TaxID=228973 RepID=A0A4V2EYB6_9MICO|nr:PTS glucose transporter subunit IIA [Xylanibacterium ulmi]RZS62420.1 PTS system N-acetylglucosamine-specific IIA component [Xylanibacterium ulmi]
MHTPLVVCAPVAGTVVAVTDVPDPVFSAGLVGPGTAIAPDPSRGADVVSPIDGRVVKLRPHAFVVAADDGRSVLVHLGIDTVELRGAGFVAHAAEGDRVVAGQPVTSWDPTAVRDGGRSPLVPVVALDADPASLTGLPGPGSAVTTSDVLFTIG